MNRSSPKPQTVLLLLPSHVLPSVYRCPSVVLTFGHSCRSHANHAQPQTTPICWSTSPNHGVILGKLDHKFHRLSYRVAYTLPATCRKSLKVKKKSQARQGMTFESRSTICSQLFAECSRTGIDSGIRRIREVQLVAYREPTWTGLACVNLDVRTGEERFD
jgi:hypothetical protein